MVVFLSLIRTIPKTKFFIIPYGWKTDFKYISLQKARAVPRLPAFTRRKNTKFKRKPNEQNTIFTVSDFDAAKENTFISLYGIQGDGKLAELLFYKYE